MELKRRSKLVNGLLAGVWLLVVAWQGDEHFRVVNAAKADLRNRAREISSTLGAVMHAMRFRGAVLQERIEPVLNELVDRTNFLVGSSGLLSIVLLNTADEPVVAVGDTNRITKEIFSEGEHWTADSVTFVNPVEGANVNPEGTNNRAEDHATVVLPSFRDFTNGIPRDKREFGPRDHGPRPPEEMNFTGAPPLSMTNESGTNVSGENELRRPSEESRQHNNNRGRPPWMRWMSDADYKALIARRERTDWCS